MIYCNLLVSLTKRLLNCFEGSFFAMGTNEINDSFSKYYDEAKEFISSSYKDNGFDGLRVLSYTTDPEGESKNLWKPLGVKDENLLYVDNPDKMTSRVSGKGRKYDIINFNGVPFDHKTLRQLQEISGNGRLKKEGIMTSNYSISEGVNGLMKSFIYHIARPLEQFAYDASTDMEKNMWKGFDLNNVNGSGMISRAITGSFFNAESNRRDPDYGLGLLANHFGLRESYDEILKKAQNVEFMGKKGEKTLFSKRSNLFNGVKGSALAESGLDFDFAGFNKSSYEEFKENKNKKSYERNLDHDKYLAGLDFDLLDEFRDLLKGRIFEDQGKKYYNESLENLVVSGILLESIDSRIVSSSRRFRYIDESRNENYMDLMKFKDAKFSEYLDWGLGEESLMVEPLGRENFQNLNNFYDLMIRGSLSFWDSREYAGDFSGSGEYLGDLKTFKNKEESEGVLRGAKDVSEEEKKKVEDLLDRGFSEQEIMNELNVNKRVIGGRRRSKTESNKDKGLNHYKENVSSNENEIKSMKDVPSDTIKNIQERANVLPPNEVRKLYPQIPSGVFAAIVRKR